VDGQNLEEFAAQLSQQLDRLQRELREDTYQPQPVRQVQIPKADKPGEFRTLGGLGWRREPDEPSVS
jgi:RNA-directed DNA polymerase